MYGLCPFMNFKILPWFNLYRGHVHSVFHAFGVKWTTCFEHETHQILLQIQFCLFAVVGWCDNSFEIKTACFLWMFSIFVGWWHPFWCNIDDNNIAVLLHSVTHSFFVLQSISLSKDWYWKVSGLMWKGR
jgi:hypothetical protein